MQDDFAGLGVQEESAKGWKGAEGAYVGCVESGTPCIALGLGSPWLATSIGCLRLQVFE